MSMQPVFLIADRIHVIGLDNYIELLNRLYDCGIRAVSIDQHSDGGRWQEPYISQTHTVLDHCRELGMSVYLTLHDGSKCDYGDPLGLPLIPMFRTARPPVTFRRIDNNRVSYRFFVSPRRVYQFHYLSSRPCTVHLFDGDGFGNDTGVQWQLIKWPNPPADGVCEFRSAKNWGWHELVFVAKLEGSPVEIELTGPTSISDLTQLVDYNDPKKSRAFKDSKGSWFYRGGERISGNGYCRTPNYRNLAKRAQARHNTFGHATIEYARHIGNPIVGTRLEWDEFNNLNETCTRADLIQDMKLCGTVSRAIFGPALVDARPGDFLHPSRNNDPKGLVGPLPCEIGNHDGLIPLAWSEETTPSLCKYNKASSNDAACAGIYLTKSDPQHWRDAGFTQAAIYFYPDQEHPTWLDFPQDKVRRIVEMFG